MIANIVYINLDERKDRDLQVQQELRNVFPDASIHRLSAIKVNPGYIGCSLSHIAALELAQRNNWPRVLIVEDDIMWTAFNTEQLELLLSTQHDVVLLSGTYVKSDGFRLLSGQTAAAYIVEAHYYDTLLSNFRTSVSRLQTGGKYNKYALDQYWKLLQTRDTWLIARPSMGIQRPGFSDIERRNVNYTRGY
uniref:Glycosyl transferase family 25 domain-containing protein n=1 Tax=viral metagenome TaxID=1070528 RepID=A0A6C0EAF1_9ZZZZ